MKYDTETLFFEMVAFFKANFNAKLIEIDAEKNDGITLKPVNDNAYALLSLDEKAFNENPFLYFGIVNISTASIPSVTAEDVQIEIVIVVTDDYDNNMDKKLFRYQRAMRELMTENYNNFTKDKAPIEITSTVPVQFELINSSNQHKAIGIEITKNVLT